MNERNVKIWFVMFSCLFFVTFSGNSQEYQKSASGILYKFHKIVKKAPKPVVGDLLTLSMVYKTQGDSLLFDSRKNNSAFTYTLVNSSFAGDFNHALLMMGEGDSASFVLRADSFFIKTLGMKKLPGFVKKSGNLNFHVKLLKIKPANEVLQEQVTYMKERTENNEKARKTEKDSLVKYLERNKITTTPTASGLIFISLQEGTGELPKAGNKVKVDYKGTFTNGKTFDSSYESGAPFEFKTGAKQVIRGFEEGIMKMKKGGKAKLIIPSSIGYGENAAGEIPPFTTLVFEIELLEIN